MIGGDAAEFDVAQPSSGIYAIGAATGISWAPRPACSVVMMPNISPLMVGREISTSRYCPAGS